MRDDFVSQAINRLAANPGIFPILLVSGIVALVGLSLLLARRTRPAGFVLATIGSVVFWLGLLAIQWAQIKVRVNPQITVGRSYFSVSVRAAAMYGLVLIPLLAGGGLAAVWRAEMERRRRMLPTYIKNALKAFFQKDYDGALAQFATAIAIDPRRAESYQRRGQVHLELGNLDRALADFNQAIDLAPENGAAHRSRGLVHLAKNDLEAALADFDFALELDRTDYSAMLNRGLCLSRMGRTDRAVAELKRVLQLTNHSDHADPAREELKRLGEID
ncbi:MAG: tetratricopeptide repeat protein [Isosphaeraceae bacterium]|nr:tetratricopeptide repeat protein [Isosphaeraceae bacterium]